MGCNRWILSKYCLIANFFIEQELCDYWMSNHALILLCAIFLSANAAIGEDIPFVFNERSSGASDFSSARIESMRSSTSDVSELPPISNPADSDILEFHVTGGGNAPDSKTEKRLES